ncbi:DUF3857 domain-containing protein [Aquimarina sp. RZ0]|uniref:DUF3857 domain-containing protein n=1 Tax=Aquimarina sp. RZ0 TaxID=2607730 RepID=UPI0011F29D88|nr:DUF3857 domain-containing protein [Aquimarina sp. RZ0]KAA1243245.1 DUF3857 domain-containing protein [Aquimarina sp. RZ0]
MKFYELLTSFIFLNFTHAQQHDYNELYPNEEVITLSLEKHIQIDESRGKLFITENVHKRNLFLSSKRLQLAEENVSYNTFNQITEIQARTENIENNKVKKSFVKRFKEKDILISGIFFNDQKEKNFFFPNVKKNSITDLKYSKTIKDPHFLPSFMSTSDIPIEKAIISITFPKNVKLTYRTFHLDAIHSKFEIEENKNHITYTWVLNKIPKINRHYDFSALYYIPQIIIYINSYKHKNKTISVLNDVSDLYKWYTSLISQINTTDQQELELITKSLIEGTTSETEKIQSIYYFVQDKINYIAFEDGLNGFIPRDASNVFNKKYGDCKDMANILNEMLQYAGIDSHLAWIGTRKKPYKYNEVPTPVTDNHMITAVFQKNSDTIFLDPTAKYLPYGYPSPFTQGKEALIGISADTFKIHKVPEIDAINNNISIISSIKLENELLTGRHIAKICGHDKLDFMHKIENKEEEDLDFLYWNLKFGTKKTSFNNIEYKNLERQKDTLQISFDSETRNYVKKINGKLYIKPIMDNFLVGELVKDESKNYDKKIDHKFTRIFHTTIEIPEGQIIEFIPENSSFRNENYEFTTTYENRINTIVITKKITVNTLKIDINEIESWNNFIKALLKSNKKTIIINPKN